MKKESKISMPDYKSKPQAAGRKSEPRSSTKISEPRPRIESFGRDDKSKGNGRINNDIPVNGC